MRQNGYSKERMGIRAISRTLQLHRATVKKYLQMEVVLPKNSPLRTKIFLYGDYIRNAVATRPGVLIKDLYHEIKAMGYKVKTTQGYINISKYMLKREKIIYPKDLPLMYWRPAQLSLLLYRRASELHKKDKEILNYVVKESTEIETCYRLFQRFRAMLENKEGDSMGKMLEYTMASSIKEFKSFSQGVLNDFKAVQTAVALLWSNVQV
jgi:hypothetical protein